MFFVDQKKAILLATGLTATSAVKVKMYAEVGGAAKFSVRCADGAQPAITDLNYVLGDADISTSQDIEGWPSASDCSDCGWGICGCEDCRTHCGTNSAFGTTHETICTDDEAAVLCTGSTCSGGLRAIGTAECNNAALELQVESSKLIVNTPWDAWVWASLTASDAILDVQQRDGWVLSTGHEFHVGGGALVIGAKSDDKIGKCCQEEGLTLSGNPPICANDPTSGGSIAGIVLPAMLLFMGWTAMF